MRIPPNVNFDYIQHRSEPVQLLYGEDSGLLHYMFEPYFELLKEPRTTVVMQGWGGRYPDPTPDPTVTRWILERTTYTEAEVASSWKFLGRDNFRQYAALTQLLYVLPHVLGSENLDVYMHYPESTLSPELQKVLADAILESVGASGCRYVIRTHSELLGLRMLRRIRGGLPQETLRVWHIKQDTPWSSRVNSGGEFVKCMWGLWDDTFDEVF